MRRPIQIDFIHPRFRLYGYYTYDLTRISQVYEAAFFKSFQLESLASFALVPVPTYRYRK